MPYIGNIVQDFSVSTAMLNTDSVTSIKVLDGTIVNADINASAAIAGTKISPDFGSQNIATTGNVSIGGTNLNMATAYIDFSGSISTPSTAAAIYRPADNQLAFSTANVERVKITNSGLDVAGSVLVGSGGSAVSDAALVVSADDSGAAVFLQRSGSGKFDCSVANEGGSLVFRTGLDSSTVAGLTERMSINGSTGAITATGDITANNINANSGLDISITSGTVSAIFPNNSQVNGITAMPSQAGTPFVVGKDTGSNRSAIFAGDVATGPLAVTGNTDVSGEITVGGTDSRFAENNLRFKSAGDAFIDHNTTGQDIKFRVSNSSSLDITPVTIQSDGQVNVGGMQFYQSNNVAIPIDGARFKLGQNDDFGLRHDANGPTIFDDAGNQGFKVQLKELNITEYTGSTSKVFINTSGDVGIGTTSPDTLLHLAGADTAIIRLENTDTSLGLSQLIGAIEFEKQDPTGAGVGIAGAIRLKSMSSVGQAASMFFATSNSSGNDQTRMTIDFDGRVLIGGATSINASTNADDLQVGASSQSNQTGITLGSAVASSLRFMDAANDSAGYILMNHTTDALTIKSNSGGVIFNVGGEVATMDSTGLKLVSGKGINFSAYATSGNPSSNLLDDYEEGTWTPQMGGSDVSKNHANYVKIGRFVHVDFDITNNSGGAHTSITNLPFDAVEYSAWHVAWVSNNQGGALASSDLIGGLVSGDSLSARGAGGNTAINIDTNVRMIGSATYQTAT